MAAADPRQRVSPAIVILFNDFSRIQDDVAIRFNIDDLRSNISRERFTSSNGRIAAVDFALIRLNSLVSVRLRLWFNRVQSHKPDPVLEDGIVTSRLSRSCISRRERRGCLLNSNRDNIVKFQ